MAASLHIFSPEVCLATELIHELSQWNQERLAQTLLIVPTQRLGTYILAGILEHHAAIRTPGIITLEKLLSQQAQLPNVALVPDSAVELILHQQLDKGSYTQLQVGHERELRLLHNELHEHGIRDEALDTLERVIAEDIYKSEDHLGSLHVRAREIKMILKTLDDMLQERGLMTRSALLAACAENISSSWSEQSLQPYQNVLFCAYTSVAKSWRSVLEKLLQDDRASFWLHEAPDLYHHTSPLKELVAWIRSQVGAVPTSTSRVPPRPPMLPKAWTAVSPMEEARWAISLAQQWIQSGLPPHEIAILISKESTYAGPLRFFARGMDHCNIALAQSFASLLPGRFLQLVHSLFHGEEECSHLLALIQHPAVEQWIRDNSNAPHVLERLREGLLKAGIPSEFALISQELPDSLGEIIKKLLNLFAVFKPERQAKVSVWQHDLDQMVKDFDIFHCSEEADILQSAEDLYASFVDSLRVLDSVSHGLMSGRFFWDLVTRHLLGGDVRGTGEPLAGLQILSIPEARSMPFTRVILVGCQEGFFPQALPQDVLLDNYLKKSMGLPGWEVLESMEDQTFHLLLARISQMVLLRSKRRGDELVVRSRFTEGLMVQHRLEEEDLPLWIEAFAVSTEGLPSLPDELEGQIPVDYEEIWANMSASRLEKLIRCPYAFLLHHLHVQDFRPPPWDGDARREGVWLHAVLESFFSGVYEGKRLLPPWDVTGEGFAESALTRLMTLTELLSPTEMKDSPIKRHLEQHAWPQFIAHLQLLGADKPGKRRENRREVGFGPGTQREVKIQVGDRWRLLIGRIDALDRFDDLTVITDYKRRKTPAISASERGLSPQLGIYALALSCFDPMLNEQPLVLGYWNIYEGQWKSHGMNQAARDHDLARLLSSRQTPDVEALKDGIKTNWLWREDEIRRRERFFADPSACELCIYDGICRKEDPRSRRRIQQQNSWAQRLKGQVHERDADAAE
ncbi:MAG TPA: PD-(D/E)XK nuclease family protein [Oligoflexus sp.]|uniref:PD-(D/E)XK nuclease family protein n=1 Tax=Oligoflexus sp. TaxID=1971216 RepID=UPI002D6D3B0C|nr:PD-(D/E)XK nuclease family protein [Oligoflexus sp.]HYX37031.1 PD-(D/E)XK nuclease family protein [Oligoflexus sp.]